MTPPRTMGALVVALLPLLAGCDRAADVWLVGSVVSFHAEGIADDGAPGTPPDPYATGDEDLWAQDSLTTAYSDPPRAGRLAGGVAAQPSDTAPSAGAPRYATARSLSRVVVPMDVRSGGRVRLEIALRLSDVELAGSGVPRVMVTGEITGEDGLPVPGGDIGTLSLEIGPNGEVRIETMPDETESLLPNGSYERVLEGPVPAVTLDPGRYAVRIELALEATAPAGSGGYQLARIGQATATLRVP